MLHHLVPKSDGITHIYAQIRDSPHSQKKRIFIGRLYRRQSRFNLHRLFSRQTVSAEKAESTAQEKGSVMVKIISHKPVGYRSLRIHRDNSRVMTQGCHNCVKSAIRISPNTYSSVIPFHVFYQPLDRIVSIARLVDFLSFLLWIIRTDIHEIAFAHIFTPYILENQNIPLSQIFAPMGVP